MKKSTELAFLHSSDLECQAVVTAMKVVYYVAKEHLPLTKYTSFINLFKSVKAEHIDLHKGGESTYYDSSYAASEFLEAISDHFTEEIIKKLASASVITLLCDESTDVATHKKLAVWARVVDIDNAQKIMKPETLFLCDVFLQKPDGQTIVEATKKELSDKGVPSKVMGLHMDRCCHSDDWEKYRGYWIIALRKPSNDKCTILSSQGGIDNKSSSSIFSCFKRFSGDFDKCVLLF